jgi:ABC-type multidrug transport system ATPase subunit
MDQPINQSAVTQPSFSLTAENLCKRFNREWIFKDLNYTFQSGNVYAITGPNGSGKSTLLQILWGQLPATSGALIYKSNQQTIPIEDIHQYVSIATPYMDLIDEFTLIEQLQFHFKLRPIRKGVSIDELLARLYLQEAKNKAISNFSSGMKQRLKLGLAFYTDAPLLFLDEPGTNLDDQAFQWYLKNLDEVIPEKTVFIASNQPEEYPGSATKLKLTQFKR